MGLVRIRLIGDTKSVYEAARRLDRHLDWKEYPVYLDKRRSQIDMDKVALYATIVEKDSDHDIITLDSYISNKVSSRELAL